MKKIDATFGIAILLTAAIALCSACNSKTQPQEAPQEPTAAPTAAKPTEPEADSTEEDGSDTEATEPLQTVTMYRVPMNDGLQLYIISESERYGVDPAIVFAIMEHESEFNAHAIGDNGESLGLMQVQERFHRDRMARLAVDDLLNPYQNATVGIDFLAYLIQYYHGNVEMAVMAYNAGQAGAHNNWFRDEVFQNEYSRAVLMKAHTISASAFEKVVTK
jgi:soluble lytic murein transglycosylase-like protein